MTTSTGKRDYSKTPKVLAYFTSHIGLVVSTNEIAHATGIEVKRIPGACATLIRQGLIESGPSRGLYIMRNPGGKPKSEPEAIRPSTRIYEFVGTAQNERVIVKDVDTDILYVLERL